MPYNYILKHKDDDCAYIAIDKADSKISRVRFTEPALCPVPGTTDPGRIKKWWAMRAVPGTGQFVRKMLAQSGCYTSQEYLERNLGLSMTDCYWICPKGSSLKWNDVKFYGKIDTKIPYHSPNSYDPNASLSGMMDKYWDMSSEIVSLVKIAESSHGQQAVNEAFASLVHERQDSGIPYVQYICKNKDGDESKLSICPSFTSEDVELISAYDVIESGQKHNDESMYEYFIRRCTEFGLDEVNTRKMMDYQTLTDFAILNTDKHLLNFGILRNSHTLTGISMSPIFDSGNSMTFKTDIDYNNIRESILKIPITAIYKKYEDMLKCVSNKTVVSPDSLPSAKEAYDFYAENGISEDNAQKISRTYEVSTQMLTEFCKGKQISLYHEKQRQRDIKSSTDDLPKPDGQKGAPNHIQPF